MNRRQLLRHLSNSGCYMVREGGKHSIWSNAPGDQYAMIPRHAEIDNHTARQICKQLGISSI